MGRKRWRSKRAMSMLPVYVVPLERVWLGEPLYPLLETTSFETIASVRRNFLIAYLSSYQLTAASPLRLRNIVEGAKDLLIRISTFWIVIISKEYVRPELIFSFMVIPDQDYSEANALSRNILRFGIPDCLRMRRVLDYTN
ncbi:hypothetical protein KPH14_001359 [Odynerus spinipes]|uniref:Uncharacterized protein n=1 Tax=Odynerus spinipes TaxID=1348599 RepID=A0AAD9VKP7_9HYME|nr:hypothetical protein KPH14_001359 [Odynerus spinipes]